MNLTSAFQWKMSSPIGELYLAATDKGLSFLGWTPLKGLPFISSLDQSFTAAKYLKQAHLQLNEYFKGKRTAFDIQLDIEGTDFQKKVWQQLLTIPFGQTQSYKDIADSLKSSAVRAVGSANGKNQICIIVPCHRVINANGGLGGFSGGLDKKEFLLKLEKQLNFCL